VGRVADAAQEALVVLLADEGPGGVLQRRHLEDRVAHVAVADLEPGAGGLADQQLAVDQALDRLLRELHPVGHLGVPLAAESLSILGLEPPVLALELPLADRIAAERHRRAASPPPLVGAEAAAEIDEDEDDEDQDHDPEDPGEVFDVVAEDLEHR